MTEDQKSPFDLDAGVPAIEGQIRPKPKVMDRISIRVAGVVIILLVVLLAVFLASVNNLDKKEQGDPLKLNKSQDNTVTLEKSNAKDDNLGDVDSKVRHSASVVAPVVPSIADTPKQKKMFEGASAQPSPEVRGKIPASNPQNSERVSEIPADVNNKNLTPEQQTAQLEKQAEIQAKMEREKRMASARASGLNSRNFEAGDKGKGAAPAGADQLANKASPDSGIVPVADIGTGGKDGNDQAEKINFLKSAAKDNRSYHPHLQVSALSYNEVKTGTFIPMALGQDINTDLPGQVTARITESVYDSITGCRLLIPAMSTVIGKYDSQVALGQSRMLVVWNSIIFPNGDELNLAGMEGYNTSGAAGLDSEVDNHFWRLFGLALGMSMVSATVQLAVPAQPANGSAAMSPSDALSMALSQQYGQLGAQILGRYMNIQPTLSVNAGARFLIVVPHTIVFTRVWKNRCT